MENSLFFKMFGGIYNNLYYHVGNIFSINKKLLTANNEYEIFKNFKNILK